MPSYDYFQNYPTSGGDVPKMFGQSFGGMAFNPQMKGKGGQGFLAAPPQVTRRYEPLVAGRDYGFGVVQPSHEGPQAQPTAHAAPAPAHPTAHAGPTHAPLAGSQSPSAQPPSFSGAPMSY